MEQSFSARVYDLALQIPPGRVTTYGDLARAAGGGAMAARSITSILSKAPNQSVIPYHRIVYAGGRVWLPDTSPHERINMYGAEGIEVSEAGRITNFADVLYTFD